MAAAVTTLDISALGLALHEAGYNGDVYLPNTTGETEEAIPVNRVLFLPNPDDTLIYRPIDDLDQRIARDSAFFLVNAAYLKGVLPTVARGHIHMLAMIRLWAAREQYFEPDRVPAEAKCRYTDCMRATQADINAVATSAITPTTEEDRHLTEWVALHKRDLVDMICLVAYIFRQRGHHFLPDLAARYDTMWTRCQRGDANPGVSWELIATAGLHAIFPDKLDAIWYWAVREDKCVGALSKRYNCAAAGAAIWSTLDTSYHDLAAAAAGLKDRLADARTVLDKAMGVIASHRWAGSVNRRFYGGPPIEVNETDVAAIAGVTKACLEAFAPSHPMLNSIALTRVAGNAPIVGAMLKMGIAAAAKSEAYSTTLLMTEGT